MKTHRTGITHHGFNPEQGRRLSREGVLKWLNITVAAIRRANGRARRWRLLARLALLEARVRG